MALAVAGVYFPQRKYHVHHLHEQQSSWLSFSVRRYPQLKYSLRLTWTTLTLHDTSSVDVLFQILCIHLLRASVSLDGEPIKHQVGAMLYVKHGNSVMQYRLFYWMNTLIAGTYFFSFTSQSIPICGRCIEHWARAWTFGNERAKRWPASSPSIPTTEYADELESNTYWRELNSRGWFWLLYF